MSRGQPSQQCQRQRDGVFRRRSDIAQKRHLTAQARDANARPFTSLQIDVIQTRGRNRQDPAAALRRQIRSRQPMSYSRKAGLSIPGATGSGCTSAHSRSPSSTGGEKPSVSAINNFGRRVIA
jgi:hypothetical protein